MFITYLLLGSNLGDRLKYIGDAAHLIGRRVGTVKVKSSIYQTASWGKHGQPDFMNCVLQVETKLDSQRLLSEVLAIETELGRERLERWGSRTIDIDILLFDDQVISEPNLQVPHPLFHLRRFSLEPLCEIAPDLNHPVLNKLMRDLLTDLSDDLLVKKLP